MTSKFLQSSSSFSETNVLKSILKPILEKYNNFIYNFNNIYIKNDNKYMIFNNNIKYYLFIINKFSITKNSSDSKYKILYFFPDKFTNIHSDFYVEIDNFKINLNPNVKTYLFEGYLYLQENLNTFFISDILSIDSNIIDTNYSSRYLLLINLFNNNINNCYNGHLYLKIQPIFKYIEDSYNNIFNIFLNNYEFKNYITNIELIDNNIFTKTSFLTIKKDDNQIKRIYKTKLIEVYNVFNIENNNLEGNLYIKTLKDSKFISNLFLKNNNEFIDILCEFNTQFQKWSVINN